MSRPFRRSSEGHVVHQDTWVTVREYNVERGGVTAKYPVVERPDSIVVIPLTPTNRTVLLKQFRFPTNESSWELPMGGINGAEPAEAGARLELMEEVGLRAKDLVRIGEYRPVPGLTPQKVTVFVVRVAEEELDVPLASWSASEEIQEISTVSLIDLVGMITDGRVTDGFSLTAMLLLRLWLDQYASKS